jgi:hypothetical protein
MIITRGFGQCSASTNIPAVSGVASTSYSPSFNDNIVITCTITNSPSYVVVKINGYYYTMTNTTGTTYSTGYVMSGTFGVCSAQTITVFATNANGGSQSNAISTITITATDASNYFRKARNVELSTTFYLETQINASWSNVNVVKSFAQVDKQPLPVVCIRLLDSNPFRRELGANTLMRDFNLIVDIFATSDGQRLDLSDFILENIKNSWTYYEWAHGSGGTMTKASNGRVQILNISQDRRVDFGTEQVNKYDKFRHTISFSVRKQ